MAEMKYLDFDLLLERSRDRFKARVINSPAGQAESDFSLPFSEIELENFLLKIGRPLRQVRRVESTEIEAAKKFGGSLFAAVFNNEVRACFRSSLDDAERLGMGLRLRLRMTNTPELTDLPWEYLYNPSLNRFLSLAQETPIIRYLELPERVRPIEVIPPLRVLVMISSPYNYPKLDVEREWTMLKEVLGPLEQQGLVTFERRDKATLSALQQMLRQKEFHIFHFIGHGGFDKQSQDGVLILEDEEGRGRAVSGQYLGTLLHNHHPLRLAILNACEGGRTSRTDPFAGTAQSLVQQGIPAVIAMQFEISDEAAITFTQEFYRALTDSYPVDSALVEARTAIFAYGNNVEWGTPVLYMRSPDGQIFNIANVEKSAILQPETSRHPVVPASTKELPPELLQAIAHPISEVREGAVKVLDGLLHGVHKEVALRAEAALKKLTEDDSRKVAAAAKMCLVRYAEAISTQRAPSASAATDVDGMITIDERGIIERFNTAAERIFGYSTEEVLNKSVSMLMPSPYRELHDGYVANYVKTGEKKIIGLRREVYGRRKDGTTFPMDIAVSEVFDGNRRTFMAIMQDITARKQAEEQLQKTKDAAEAAQKAAKRAAPKPVITERPKSPKALWIGIAAVAVIAIVVVLFIFKKPASNLSDSTRVEKPTTNTSPDTAKISEPTPTQPTAPLSEVNQQKPAEVITSKESGVKKKSGETATGGSLKESERRAEEQNAAAAKEEMLKAKQSVPGSEKDKSASAAYQQAENLAKEGESQFQAGNFRSAQKLF
ncbi:MAG: PAS domain S-box protein, partial [bacterium]